MESHIYCLVDDLLTPDILWPKAIQCLHGYRKAGLETVDSADVADAYNAFLLRWRTDLESDGAVNPNRLAFWAEVMANGI